MAMKRPEDDSRDPAAARALNERMSAISEKYWYAAWLMDLEHSLWAMLEGGPRRFGCGEVTEGELRELRELSQKADGWWRWSDADGDEVFVDLDEWRRIARARA
jgi:hypothetical protein